MKKKHEHEEFGPSVVGMVIYVILEINGYLPIQSFRFEGGCHIQHLI